MEIYIVRPGDDLNSIAGRAGLPKGAIIYDNQLVPPYDLVVGQALLLTDETNTEARRKIDAGGYVYPYVDEKILEDTLPHLSKLGIFSYGFTKSGDLVPPKGDDTWIIESAGQHRTLPILTLTPLGSDGRFDDTLITAVISSQVAIQRLIDQLIQTMTFKGYRGLNIDFEYIAASDRENYTHFVREVTIQLNALDYMVSVALAPVTSDEQRSVLVSGIDYQAIGEVANYVYLMTYEWGYAYGPNMAVAPYDKVREVLDYAVTKISPEKISLGIPNYGYDWPLPFVQGETRAISLGTTEAIQIASAHNATIQFDFVSVSPFFRYTKDGTEHEVWFEDVRSLQAKYALVEEYGLRGCFFWQNMRLYRAGLLLLSDMYWIKKDM